ncbi:Nif3-like dinuclear metal center hexameric protein [Enterococcus sp. HY326]|uniref:Nif3-like dinuclear metal center hexameric protein n=1 Tax=Enterococcus sp. HY326 TaxID=2971265 RepID=UPI00223F07CB|nr:Nif3-like dinuclear metal center hexameric protein [Enterococcus sp. HY326]
MVKAQTVIQRFEEFCPQWLSMEDDISGLQVGSLDKEIKNVMVTLDIRPQVVAEAIEKKVDLIITKHAPLFRPVQMITDQDVQTKMAMDLIRHDIAVYVAHTNMDIVDGGLNDWFMEALAVPVTGYLSETHRFPMMKLAVFVPTEEAKALREVLGKAGAGVQGNYQHTSFSTTGTGRFIPVKGAQPAIGKIDEATTVQETKIEVIFPEPLKEKIVKAMVAAHPYEEVAYDLYELKNAPQTFGIGRIGELPTAISIDDFIERSKKAFGLAEIKVVFPTKTKQLIKKIAICGGSGGNFYKDALRLGADVYITGDVYYHTAHDMQSAGLTVLDPGHYIETLCKEKIVALLKSWQIENNWELEAFPSAVSTNPFTYR